MSGSLTIPTTFNNLAQGNQPLSLFDGSFGAIATYVNAREITVGLAAARPAFGVQGRYYFATDTNGGTLYEDTGTGWQQLAPGLTEPAQNAYAQALQGLTLSNDSGTPNTILDVAAGACTDDNTTITSRILMVLPAITGTISGTWVVGTGQPKLDGGAVTINTWYDVYAIKRTDTGVTDIVFGVGGSPVNLPTNYNKKRRIGSFLTDGSSHIIAFKQQGDEFLWNVVPTLNVNATNPGTAAVTTVVTTPLGTVTTAILAMGGINGSNNWTALLSPLAISDQAPSSTAAPLGTRTQALTGPIAGVQGPVLVRTDVFSTIRYRLSASGASDIFRLATWGWMDRRGQDN